MDHSKESLLELVIACGHAPKLLEFTEQPLDTVTLPIALLHKRPRLTAVATVGNVGKHVPVETSLPLFVPVESFVAVQLIKVRHTLDGPLQHRLQQRRIARLTGNHFDRHRGVLVRRRYHDFAGKTAATTAQTLPGRPGLFFSRSGGVLVGTDDGAIDQYPPHLIKGRAVGQQLEQPPQTARGDPTAEAIVDGIPGAEVARQVTPRDGGTG